LGAFEGVAGWVVAEGGEDWSETRAMAVLQMLVHRCYGCDPAPPL
jgi:hypothetical protein